MSYPRKMLKATELSLEHYRIHACYSPTTHSVYSHSAFQKATSCRLAMEADPALQPPLQQAAPSVEAFHTYCTVERTRQQGYELDAGKIPPFRKAPSYYPGLEVGHVKVSKKPTGNGRPFLLFLEASSTEGCNGHPHDRYASLACFRCSRFTVHLEFPNKRTFGGRNTAIGTV